MQTDEFKKVLGIAITRERQILELYQFYRQPDLPDRFINGFAEIFSINQQHLAILEGLNRKIIPATEVDCLPDLELTDGQIDIIISNRLTYRDIIIMGMKLVNELCKIYNFMGQVPDKSEISNLFLTMAQEELHHKTLLESEYDAIDIARLP